MDGTVKTASSGKQANHPSPDLSTKRPLKETESITTILPSLWSRVSSISKNPQETLNSVLNNRALLKNIVFFIFGLAAFSFLCLFFSPAEYRITAWLYIKLLGVVYFGAFYGLYIQSEGLAGPNGIAPVAETMNDLGRYYEILNRPGSKFGVILEEEDEEEKPLVQSSLLQNVWKSIDSGLSKWSKWSSIKLMFDKYLTFPTLFWFSYDPKTMPLLFNIGMGASLALIVGVGPAPILIATMYLCYLSFMHTFDEFLALQWDVLILECGFASMLLSLSSHGFALFHFLPSQTGEPSRFVLFALWWLVFRLMFASGVVKLTSRDKTWADLTAMTYHYRTQPLPTPSSHFMHNLPLWFHKIETLGTFVIELILPLMMFGTSHMRVLASISFVFLNTMISTTGNYGFFNILTIVLSLLLLDDNVWTLNFSAFYPSNFLSVFSIAFPQLFWSDLVNLPLFVMAALFSGILMNRAFRANLIEVPSWVNQTYKKISSFYLLSSYGLFAVMTTKRIELVIEGSKDGENWKEYEFKYKPGDVRRAPPAHPFHLPRLDWRMWFCAFNRYPNVPGWFMKFLLDLGNGKKEVLDLMGKVPFDASDPPTYLRVLRYDYQFTTPAQLKEKGEWWTREYKGVLFPSLLRVNNDKKKQ